MSEFDSSNVRRIIDDMVTAANNCLANHPLSKGCKELEYLALKMTYVEVYWERYIRDNLPKEAWGKSIDRMGDLLKSNLDLD